MRVHNRQHPDFPLKHFVRCGECGRPLTGYWARGRSDRYAYYECPGCRLRAGRDAVEHEFVAFLTELRPKPEFLHLFKADVLDVWNARQAEAVKAAEELRLRAADIRTGREKLVEAFVYQRALDRPTFDAMVAKLEAVGAVDNARSEAHLADLDAGALVDYAIHVVTNAGTLWRDVEPAQRAQLQAFLFPEGLRWKRDGFV